MLYNINICIAFKNLIGEYDLEQFSLFELEKTNRRFTSLQVKINRNKELLFKVKCPLCGEYHYYNYNVSEFFKRDMTIGGCETLGVPLFYIGHRNKVENKINKHKETSKKLYAMI